ncbi:MAG: site-specific integrase [Polaromonas sp.]
MAGGDVRDPVSLAAVVAVWRRNRCLRRQVVLLYRRWIRRFAEYCQRHGLEEDSQPTRAGIAGFVRWYARSTKTDRRHFEKSVHSALRAWALTRRLLGDAVPRWSAPQDPLQRCPQVLRDFSEHLRVHRGKPAGTIHKKLRHIETLLDFLRRRRRRLQRLQLSDVDAFVVHCSRHHARATVADMGSSVRGFVRFLRASGRVSTDFSASIMAPTLRRGARPHRALPWDDVRRILQAVDRSTRCGKRDYAMLLMMSTYGLGAGEITRLTMDDIDWRAATLHVVRPKTGVEFLLPLLPVVARVLSDYLRRGRPVRTPTRHLFVSMHIPHERLSGSGPIRHRLLEYARHAGVSAPYLGTHVLRHTHACRQMELGTPPKVIGDILGHRNPESTSAYLRVATERLREIALPVPS